MLPIYCWIISCIPILNISFSKRTCKQTYKPILQEEEGCKDKMTGCESIKAAYQCGIQGLGVRVRNTKKYLVIYVGVNQGRSY